MRYGIMRRSRFGVSSLVVCGFVLTLCLFADPAIGSHPQFRLHAFIKCSTHLIISHRRDRQSYFGRDELSKDSVFIIDDLSTEDTSFTTTYKGDTVTIELLPPKFPGLKLTFIWDSVSKRVTDLQCDHLWLRLIDGKSLLGNIKYQCNALQTSLHDTVNMVDVNNAQFSSLFTVSGSCQMMPYWDGDSSVSGNEILDSINTASLTLTEYEGHLSGVKELLPATIQIRKVNSALDVQILPNSAMGTVRIFDLLGNSVRFKIFPPFTKEIMIDMQSMRAGCYFIAINSEIRRFIWE